VQSVLSFSLAFIDRPEKQEYFQRKFGIDPNHKKDTRDFSREVTVTAKVIEEMIIRNEFIKLASLSPIAKIDTGIINKIVDVTGLRESIIELTLSKLYPHGAIGSFLSNYFEMAFAGRDNAIEFERATTEVFESIFGFHATHIGSQGLTPDILLRSEQFEFQGIVDNKAYSRYSISNDHRNRMIHNYINGFRNYSKHTDPLSFFAYISGGFGINIDSQIESISKETGVVGSAISISIFISLIDEHIQKPIDQNAIRKIFSLNRQVLMSDLHNIRENLN
jgi:hypothetical protein